MAALKAAFERHSDLPRWRVPDLPELHAQFYGEFAIDANNDGEVSDEERKAFYANMKAIDSISTYQNAPTQCSTCPIGTAMSRKIWKTLDEFYDRPAVAEAKKNEFDQDVQGALTALRREYGINDDGSVTEAGHQPLPLADSQQHHSDLRQLLPSVSRRGFMKLTGAAAVFGLAGCWHEQLDTIVPFRQQGEGHGW